MCGRTPTPVVMVRADVLPSLNPLSLAVRRQMVWKGTTQVGCGRTPNCASIAGFGPGTMYSCRYSPPGAQLLACSAGLTEIGCAVCM